MRLLVWLVGLALSVLLRVAEGDISSREPCDTADHLHTCLCSFPEYHVRRMRRSLWASTTVWDFSVTSGHARTLRKLQRYLSGQNNQGLRIPHEGPLATQTYVPTGFMREVTVSLPLPQDMWNNPPVPEDPEVVLDVIPETVLYVKPFGRRGDLGFIAEQEAQTLLDLLMAEGEPITRKDDYYYILQHSSGNALWRRYEVAIFATNAVLDEFYRVTDGPKDRLSRLPRCLRKKESLWSSEKASINVDLVRRDCGTTFCYGPDCPTYSLRNKDKHGVEKRSYRNVGPFLRAGVLTCQFERAKQQGQKLMFQELKENGLTQGGHFSRFSPVVTTVVQSKPWQGPCSRTYTSYTPVPRDVVTELPLEKAESFWYTCEDLAAYVMCFGGHGSAGSSFEAGRRLSTVMAEREESVHRDAMAVVEYNIQSRIFDRHNEILMEIKGSERSCLHPGRSSTTGKHSLNFSLPNDWYTEHLYPHPPHPCTSNQCPQTKVVRTFDHFQEKHYLNTRWVCTQERSCESRSGRDKAMSGLLFYINGRNLEAAKIEMTQPVLTIHNVSEESPSACDKLFTVCLYLPSGHHDNPPRPVDTQVYISEPVEKLELFSLHYHDRKSDQSRDKYVAELAHNVTTEMDSMPSHFDVTCEKEVIAEQLFMTEEEQEWHELGFFRKLPSELFPGEDGHTDDVVHEECQNEACFHHEKVQDWDGFSEYRFDIGKWVCKKTTGCDSGNPRDVFLALTSYFDGKNVAGRRLGDMMAPVVMQYKNVSEDQQTSTESCREEVEACAPLPKYYQRNNAPTPSEEGLMLRQVVTPSMYIIRLKGHFTPLQLSNRLETLKLKLQETGLQFDKDANLFYTYDQPFTPEAQRLTYTGFWKLQTVG